MKDFKVYQTSGMLNFLVSEASDVRAKEQKLSGDIVSFSADEQSPLKIVVDIDSTGWTGCEVTRTGANLFGGIGLANNVKENLPSATIDTTAKTVSFPYSASAIANAPVIDGIEFKENTQYTFIFSLLNALIARTNLNIVYTDGSNTTITMSKTNEKEIVVATSAANKTVKCLCLIRQGGTTVIYYDETGIFEGVLTADDFEPYQGNTYSVTFPDEVGSVTDGLLTINYDGSVTLKTSGQTYTLTSVSPIESLIGDNNIWADAGQVSVTYPI